MWFGKIFLKGTKVCFWTLRHIFTSRLLQMTLHSIYPFQIYCIPAPNFCVSHYPEAFRILKWFCETANLQYIVPVHNLLIRIRKVKALESSKRRERNKKSAARKKCQQDKDDQGKCGSFMWKGQETWWQRTWIKLRYFTVKTCFQKSQILETNRKVWRKEDLTVLEKDLVRIKLKPYVVKALGSNWIHSKVLRETVYAILRVPSIYKRSQQLAGFLKDHKKTNVTLRRARRTIQAIRDQPVPTSIHRKGMKQVILENISEGFQQTGEWSGRNLTKFKEKWQFTPGQE